MTQYGIDVCLLCSRAAGQPKHETLPDGYPLSWTRRAYKVRFYPGDYCVEGATIRQRISGEEPLHDVGPMSGLYTLCVDKAEEFNMAVCLTLKCKDPVHSRVGAYKALGYDRCYMDLEDETLKCEHCDAPLHMLCSVNNEIIFNGITYTTCFMCDTVLSKSSAMTICRSCEKRVKSEIQRSTQTCLRCKRFVSSPDSDSNEGTQRGTQVFYFDKEPAAYMCREHRIYPKPRHVSSRTALENVANLYFSRPVDQVSSHCEDNI